MQHSRGCATHPQSDAEKAFPESITITGNRTVVCLCRQGLPGAADDLAGGELQCDASAANDNHMQHSELRPQKGPKNG